MKRALLPVRALLRALCAVSTCFALGGAASAQSGKVEVLWLGQSAFRITSPGGKVIVVDPWLQANPSTPAKYKELQALGKIDVILVTHGHGDHIGDAPALAKMHNVPIRTPGDLAWTLGTLGVLPTNLLPRFNKGGVITPAPGIRVTATRAEHSSNYVWRNPTTGRDEAHPGGEPLGYLIELENGFRIWHMGDTDVFGDMKLVAERHKPDLVLVPIGGVFTMGATDAAFAVREFIRPRYAIPMHYGANPLATGTPKEFIDALGTAPVKVVPLKPGEAVEF
jgi:L-ascorbate metabolism protein UlaG (beta-lactamase superfamily)